MLCERNRKLFPPLSPCTDARGDVWESVHLPRRPTPFISRPSPLSLPPPPPSTHTHRNLPPLPPAPPSPPRTARHLKRERSPSLFPEFSFAVNSPPPPFPHSPHSKPGSSSAAKSRIKLVLAHDRAGVDTETMGKIRAEIFAVVSKYLVIDESAINFDLLTDEKMTMLTATMPVIRSPEARRTVSSIASPPLVID